MLKLFKDEIYAAGTVRPNRKQISTLKADKQMKRGEHDWLACHTISATKCMDNRSVILLSNYHNPRVVQEHGCLRGDIWLEHAHFETVETGNFKMVHYILRKI